MQTIKQFWQANRKYLLASFLIPLLIMMTVYLILGIYPGSSRSVLASDAFSQFSNFHASFRNMLLGQQSLLYTWNGALGLNYLSLVSYYLGGFFTPLVILFPNQLMPDALYVLTLLKIGSAGLAFWFYAKHTFKIAPWSQVALAIFYALMSFVTAHSELVMWLDAFVYLPLIIWGIDRLLTARKPRLLFVSYLMLFLSSFYMGFMIGVFSFLYFLTRLVADFKQNRRQILMYGLTSLLAGGASMVIILPAILDLRANGETLTAITTLKTEATSYLDILMKNMVGVYDTTKYGSIPFIYAGLLPLALCLFYFFCKQVRLRDKLLNLTLFAILIASFYFVPLNLFWHGFHAPNMFLFRYAFLFSFMVVMCAGYGWQVLSRKNDRWLLVILATLFLAFTFAYALKPATSYDYISIYSLLATLAFLLLYGLITWFSRDPKISSKALTLVLLVVVIGETGLNTGGMLHGILDDWNYASRSLYTDPYPAIKTLVDQTKQSNDGFYRLENLDPVSSNDSFNYGYSGISMFSSIRNRHSSSYLDALGYRSRGTNLNIRYANNTLLMDSLLGVKYNLSKTELNKFGFTKIAESGAYRLYENNQALPLAYKVDTAAANALQKVPNDNLSNQTNLLNTLAGQQLRYFSFHPITVVSQKNVKINENEMFTFYNEEEANQAKEVTWQVQVPAHTQAYLSLYPYNFGDLKSSNVTVMVNGEQRKSQINITGQYYDLGYYDTATTVVFSASFYGTDQVAFQKPQVVALDTQALQQALEAVKDHGVTLSVHKTKVAGEVTTDQDQLLVTTIPYDKGWRARLDGQEVPTQEFQEGFIAVAIPAGKHQLQLRYVPQGFYPGLILFLSCLLLFVCYDFWLRKSQRKTIPLSNSRSRRQRRSK